MFDVKTRQTMLKELGFYNDKIDGIEGKNTINGYHKLQNKYFFRKCDKDGKYGINTDKLLYNVYILHQSEYFDYLKDKCYCRCKGKYCTGSPEYINSKLIVYLNDFRGNYYKKPITITSFLRCNTWNKIQGGASGSRHKLGKGLDFKCNDSLDKKKKHIDYFVKSYIGARYGYTNGYGNNGGKKSKPNYKSMSNSIHIDVK